MPVGHCPFISSYLLACLLGCGFVISVALTEPQVNKMRRTARTLTALNNGISDNLLAIAIILSLPASYSTLQTILMSQETQSTEDVMAKIYAEEARRQESATQSAFMARFRSGNKGEKSTEKKKRTRKKCEFCGSVLKPAKTIGVRNVHAITKSLTVMSRIRRDI